MMLIIFRYNRIDHCYENGFQEKNIPFETSDNFQPLEKFPFELLCHTINSAKLNEMKSRLDSEQFELQDEFLTTYLSSQVKTRLIKEMGYLEKCGLINVDSVGDVRLANSWDAHVPAFILYDMMEEGWDINRDRQNRFCLHEDVRTKLSKNWIVTDEGWSRSEFPDTILYHHDEYTQCKQLFQDKWTERENEADGIAQFGI